MEKDKNIVIGVISSGINVAALELLKTLTKDMDIKMVNMDRNKTDITGVKPKVLILDDLIDNQGRLIQGTTYLLNVVDMLIPDKIVKEKKEKSWEPKKFGKKNLNNLW